ncbi:hypothetical protein [Agaribacter marinus]|uniref:Uncharacterized protein n=1 Tax=Agaribacter marinus TaxID=1431249 RepID=A0AA37WIT6_9ALTE|nr:hypothetical protein [Agaribacter marinus]GLR71477.1 hypothetical protein GCM10007852_23850 [Agaribacter marinus]
MTDTELKEKIQLLERQLGRERASRKQAEEVIRQKTLDLLDANQRLDRTIERLNQALYASGESVWEWQSKEDTIRIYLSIDKTEVKIKTIGNLEAGFNLVSKKNRAKLIESWNAHKIGETKKIDMHVNYFNEDTNGLRWARVCGQFVSRDASGVGTHFIGIVKDITRKYEQQITLNTIAHSFLRSAEPMFILKLDSMHVETTIAAEKLLSLPEIENIKDKQIALADALPLDAIKKHQQNEQAVFEEELTLASGKKVLGKFRLFPGYKNESTDEDYEFAVGSFKFKIDPL